MFMPFFLSSSTVLMACFCVKHLHNSQDCQKGDLYLLCLSVHMHVRTHMRIHTLLQIPASVFWQRQGACSHLILTGKGKFWENLAAPWWWSTDSTYHQLQDHFRLWPVSMVSIFPESVIEPRGWQGFSCCHYASPSFCLLWETDWEMEDRYQNVDIQNISVWQNDIYKVLKTYGYHTFKAKCLAKEQVSWLIQTNYYSTGPSCHL